MNACLTATYRVGLIEPDGQIQFNKSASFCQEILHEAGNQIKAYIEKNELVEVARVITEASIMLRAHHNTPAKTQKRKRKRQKQKISKRRHKK